MMNKTNTIKTIRMIVKINSDSLKKINAKIGTNNLKVKHK